MEIRTWRVEHLEVYCQPGFAPVWESSLPSSDHQELCLRGQVLYRRLILARDVQAIPWHGGAYAIIVRWQKYLSPSRPSLTT
jgi:hypothetical protein